MPSIESADAELTIWGQPLLELQRSIKENRFTLLCQPIRALKTDRAYPIAEVLVRLQEEEQALLPPGDFLPIFEHYGMMPLLDRWVVDHTIQRLAEGSRIPAFSVNVAWQTLKDGDFPRFVASALKKADINPKSLLFEIDETDVLTHIEDSVRFASDIKGLGCGVMLDGFGRKAVSFASLKTVRPDFLKIDGSVTRRVLTNENYAKKLKAMVRVADALGIGVIGECIEEQDVLTRIKAYGVGFAQGFGVVQPHAIHLAATKQ